MIGEALCGLHRPAFNCGLIAPPCLMGYGPGEREVAQGAELTSAEKVSGSDYVEELKGGAMVIQPLSADGRGKTEIPVEMGP